MYGATLLQEKNERLCNDAKGMIDAAAVYQDEHRTMLQRIYPADPEETHKTMKSRTNTEESIKIAEADYSICWNLKGGTLISLTVSGPVG